jgi:hypothetical protein
MAWTAGRSFGSGAYVHAGLFCKRFLIEGISYELLMDPENASVYLHR